MTKFIFDGVIKVRFLPTVANPAGGPTMAEVTAGVDLTPFMRSLDTPLAGGTVDAATADSKFNSTVAGNYGGQDLTGEFVRHLDDADDDAWNTLARGTRGWIFRADRGGSGVDGALAAGDIGTLYEIDVHTRNPVAYGRGTLSTFTVGAGVQSEPVEDVAIAAT